MCSLSHFVRLRDASSERLVELVKVAQHETMHP